MVTPAKERVAKSRARKRAEKALAQAGVTDSPEKIKSGAAAIVTARQNAEAKAEQTASLGDAFGAGMAAALFRSILDAYAEPQPPGWLTQRENELRDWLARPQPCKWMFLHYLTERGIWGDFQDWLAESESAAGD